MAQKSIVVTGEYTYYTPSNTTLDNAKQIALERAKIQALANTFGTTVSQINSVRVENNNGKSNTEFLSIRGSEVKGEWIETIGEPKYTITFEQESLIVSVQVKGKVREISSMVIDIQPHILRNGTEDRFESSEFSNGDDLYLSFLSPVSGYLAVYLVDANGEAFCLLPYRSQTDGVYRIEANRRYVFFDRQQAPRLEQDDVDEYVLTCNRASEQNQIYIIFSPNAFVKASDADNGSTLPRMISFEHFQKWLAKCKHTDRNIQTICTPILIQKHN